MGVGAGKEQGGGLSFLSKESELRVHSDEAVR